jgi:hypothetical protein
MPWPLPSRRCGIFLAASPCARGAPDTPASMRGMPTYARIAYQGINRRQNLPTAGGPAAAINAGLSSVAWCHSPDRDGQTPSCAATASSALPMPPPQRIRPAVRPHIFERRLWPISFRRHSANQSAGRAPLVGRAVRAGGEPCAAMCQPGRSSGSARWHDQRHRFENQLAGDERHHRLPARAILATASRGRLRGPMTCGHHVATATKWQMARGGEQCQTALDWPPVGDGAVKGV